jgi:uncharacterized membrane protein YkgB
MTLTLLSVVVGAAALLYGAAKIRLFPQMYTQARTLGIHYPQFRLLGAIEVVLGILVILGIWVAWLGTLGAVLLTLVMAIQIVLHARANDVIRGYIVPATIGILAFILLLGHVFT